MLTGVQLGPIYFFFSVFGVDVTFCVRLVNNLLKLRWKQVCFHNYILDNTLDDGTPDGDDDFNDNNDDDNNNRNSDDHNVDE